MTQHSQRQYSKLDNIINRLDQLLRLLPHTAATHPTEQFTLANGTTNEQLSPAVQQHSAALMRVNHSGEVCAQALYVGQALVARETKLAEHLYSAAAEEKAHLSWCAQRIKELHGRRSFLNPLWALGSLGMGVAAGLLGDKFSLSFLAETEKQVTDHLDTHLAEISPLDRKSRAILTQMRADETKHATQALDLGGVMLPQPIRRLMVFCSKLMTISARYI